MMLFQSTGIDVVISLSVIKENPIIYFSCVTLLFYITKSLRGTRTNKLFMFIFRLQKSHAQYTPLVVLVQCLLSVVCQYFYESAAMNFITIIMSGVSIVIHTETDIIYGKTVRLYEVYRRNYWERGGTYVISIGL